MPARLTVKDLKALTAAQKQHARDPAAPRRAVVKVVKKRRRFGRKRGTP